jgi:hypothetical protein
MEKIYCFFHVLWLFIGKKHDLSKKNSEFLEWNQNTINKKRFKNRMKSPQSQRRVKTIQRLLYIPRPFQRYQLCEDWSVETRCFGATKGRRQNEKYSYMYRLIPGQRHKRVFKNWFLIRCWPTSLFKFYATFRRTFFFIIRH